MIKGNQVYRVLDVNFNRLREGLRVVEDYCRLVCDDEQALRIKDMRHRLRRLPDEKSVLCTLAARQVESDIGRRTFTDSEADRGDWRELVQANLKRAQEAARVIEECSKLIDQPGLSREIKALRFELYDLEKDIIGSRHVRIREWFALDNKKAAALYLVADENFYRGSDLLGDLRAILKAGIDLLQWRQKSGSDSSFLERAQAVRDLCREFKTPFVVNDRPDIALLVEADALHLGQDDLPIAAARALVGEQMPIGRSTHSLAQARAAAASGADYIGFGPIFKTPSKAKPDPEVGIAGLVEMLPQVSVPVVAIGGLDEDNLAAVAATGVAGVAVIRALLQTPSPAAKVGQLRKLTVFK
ncbi:MAG: thiamine phosphate synthase [Deltaproteobacteria bacterium]|nr:thiamine phosphate synthase [Deltaproteobacteria bacterium]